MLASHLAELVGEVPVPRRPVGVGWPTSTWVRCSIKKKPGSNRASRNPLTQHNSDILPDGSLDYPDDVLARLAGPKLIRTKVMPTAPRAPAVIAPQWTPDA